MALDDLIPKKQEIEKLFDTEYLKDKSIWWWGEQILSLLFVLYAINLSVAVADYKMTIQNELQDEGCYEFMKDNDNPELFNESETFVEPPEMDMGPSKNITDYRESNYSGP